MRCMQTLQSGMLPAFLPQEAGVLRLRALYERRGYRRITPPRFEDYALCLDNKNFLGTDRILTFMDPGGRLLALKPDVTLSIAKTVLPGELPAAEKLYYIDEVTRLSPDNQSYRVTEQIGLERIGREDVFAGLEVLDLALKSLALIGEESAMDVSHLAFVAGLLEDAALEGDVERKVLAAIHARSIHDLSGILEAADVRGERRDRILTLAGLHGPLSRQLERARELVRGSRMEAAYRELEAISGALEPGIGQGLNLDFSVVGDLDYYNGLVFRGYIKGISGVVCGGGRYDNLLKKLGKSSSAVGFAVYLHRLEGYYATYTRQTDVLLRYPAICDWKELLERVDELEARGLTVRCEREDSDCSGISYAMTRKVSEEGALLDD